MVLCHLGQWNVVPAAGGALMILRSPPGIHQFIDAGSHSRPRLEIVAAGAAKLATHSVPALSVSGVCLALR